MADENEPVAVRKPRADAERNRVRLLETAKAAFAEKGSGASLDEIARTAGVGAGLLCVPLRRVSSRCEPDGHRTDGHNTFREERARGTSQHRHERDEQNNR